MFNSEDTVLTSETRRLPLPERRLSVTPLDLRQPSFKAGFRGFDCDEVTSFLQEAAADYEKVVLENERLREELSQSRTSLNASRELEGTLKSTLVSAQKVADDIRATAERDAAKIVRDAESQADLLKARAEVRLEEMQGEIDGLALKRQEALKSVESALSTLRDTVEFMKNMDDQDVDVPAASVPAASQPALGPESPISAAFPSETAGFESELEAVAPSTATMPLAIVRTQSA